MDSRYSGYSTTGSNTSYPTVSSIPTRLIGTLKFDSRTSPNSPFSIPYDTEIVPTYTDSTDPHSSTDNISESSNSSMDYIQQSRTPSFSSHQNNLFFLQNPNSNQQIRHTLLELETALMGPDEDDEATTSSHQNIQSQSLVAQMSRESYGSHSHQSESPQSSPFQSPIGVPPHQLKELLILCATALDENRMSDFQRLEPLARASIAISGEPIQRVGCYMFEGLVARKDSSGTNIYRSLKCNEPVASQDLLSYMHTLYDICPYLKFGYMAANGAIAEACRNEDRIHIVDFQIAQGTQWMILLRALAAASPSGPPHVRITGIDDPVSKYARGAGLAAVEKHFADISAKFNIPVEFHAVPVYAPDITKEMLDVRPGEALVVNFPLQLHHTPDESVDVSNPRDGLLRMIKSLNPKVVTLIEQESNTNTTSFVPRFIEALDFYTAMFESIDFAMMSDKKEQINVEQQCLARDLVNIIACEGKERVERHELLGKWRSRFKMAGFRTVPLSRYVNSVIRDLLIPYSENYTLLEGDGAMLLGWKDRYLVSASAWQ